MHTPLENLRWHVEYARKEQIHRLNQHLKESTNNTIATFHQLPGEWRTSDLLTYSLMYIKELEEEQAKKKPNKLLFWKK
jgi:hypothetical protein